MSETTPNETQNNRLPQQAREIINRQQTISFTFDGKLYTAHAGDTIASALAAAGVQVMSRSYKYHHPRGLVCGAGHCANCLVQIGEEMNVRACVTSVTNGMNITAQNVWPSLEYDARAVTALANPLLSIGSQHKTFIHSQSLWPTYEHVLRQAKGLGKANPNTTRQQYKAEDLKAEVVVIGGGPAGLSAAFAAAQQGASVILCESQESLGGHARYAGNYTNSDVSKLIIALQQLDNVTVLTNTVVFDLISPQQLRANSPQAVYTIHTQQTILATGAYERPLVFGNNDLPGIMLGSAVQRLLALYSVVPGHNIFVVTTNDEGWDIAKQLQDLGINLAGVADERAGETYTNPVAMAVAGTGIPVFWKHTVKEAKGSGHVRSIIVAPIPTALGVDKQINCDLIILSTGWTPASSLLVQAGTSLQYDTEQGEFLPALPLPHGLHIAGRVASTEKLDLQIKEGRFAGLNAAHAIGKGDEVPSAEYEAFITEKNNHKHPTTNYFPLESRKKQFVCYCQDILQDDIETAVAEGFNSLELLQRYTNVTQGPCQGKLCAHHVVQLCAHFNERTVTQTGDLPTYAPAVPTKLGMMASGQPLSVYSLPLHEWHQKHQAHLVKDGDWLTPAHYGSPTAEVKAVYEHTGIMDMSAWGKVRLSGTDVPAFLQHLQGETYVDLPVGEMSTGFLYQDGYVIANHITARLADQTYLLLISATTHEFVTWLTHESQSWSNLSLVDITYQYGLIQLAGHQLESLMGNFIESPLTTPHIQKLSIADTDCWLLPAGYFAPPSYLILAPTSHMLNVWERLVANGQVHPIGTIAQKTLRLESNHTLITEDTDVKYGIIAERQPDNRYHFYRFDSIDTKQRLVSFVMTTPKVIPDVGLQIVKRGAFHQWRILGRVTASAYSPHLNKTIGLCWLPTESTQEDGEKFTIWLNKDLLLAQTHLANFDQSHVNDG